jgi:7-cyano-7-deazaguanine reductase
MEDQAKDLTKLGSAQTDYQYDGPAAEILETFPNNYPDREYYVKHETDEFTSLCPKTGQPDFATIKIVYVPGDVCVESKSLKLYLFAYRQYGSFMETIVNKILDDLVAVLNPSYIKIHGAFKARGGITIDVIADHYGREYGPFNSA